MKRIGKLWPQITTFENLLAAWHKARQGKRNRDEVALFNLHLEHELLALQADLLDGCYQPGAYRQFTIYERKPRLISAAPFRDRVVHHALMNVVEPQLDARFIDTCFACRKGRGVHAAVDYYQRQAQRYAYVLKVDVRRYFPSIDHALLKACLARRIKDEDVLALFERIIDSHVRCVADAQAAAPFPGDDLLASVERPCGIPIGNLTSQFLANLYLDTLDHTIKERWKVPAYLRYVDDLIFLADDKASLWDVRARLEEALAQLRLRLHPTKVHLMRTAERVDMLGYMVSPRRRWLRNDNGYRFCRRLRTMACAYAQGRLDWNDFTPRVASWIGHARHGETEGLRTAIFDAVTFSRTMLPGAGQ